MSERLRPGPGEERGALRIILVGEKVAGELGSVFSDRAGRLGTLDGSYENTRQPVSLTWSVREAIEGEKWVGREGSITGVISDGAVDERSYGLSVGGGVHRR